VVVLSPWLSDVTVQLPITDRTDERRLRLSEGLRELPETEVRVIVRTGEEHNDYIRGRLPGHVEFTELEDLHAKAIVAPEFVYIGSANITRGGLEVNRELCEIIENEYGTVEAYLRAELDIDV
jgi:phosphatidylserine/phosphatidylglycerophosphate/cardiolipin synthase-like enzyme